jgi:hypothetical protein
MSVPGGRESATLRDPATGRTFRDQVKAILILRESSSLRWSRLPLERTGERASRRWSASVVP